MKNSEPGSEKAPDIYWVSTPYHPYLSFGGKGHLPNQLTNLSPSLPPLFSYVSRTTEVGLNCTSWRQRSWPRRWRLLGRLWKVLQQVSSPKRTRFWHLDLGFRCLDSMARLKESRRAVGWTQGPYCFSVGPGDSALAATPFPSAAFSPGSQRAPV